MPRTEDQYQECKELIFKKLTDRINQEKFDNKNPKNKEMVRQELKRLQDAERMVRRLLTQEDRERIIKEILDELFGLGPLQDLIDDKKNGITDILVNGYSKIYIERNGKLEEMKGLKFKNNEQLMHYIDIILSDVNKQVNVSNPMADARLRDGSRVNVIVPPLSLDGPILSIRRFPAEPLKAEALLENGTLDKGRRMLNFLRTAIEAKLNILISGGTGSGKTTLLNILSNSIPKSERIITIEDAAELQLQQPHVVHLETKPANVEGKGALKQRDLVVNALRMRPDRIILGEVRGEEAVDMLQAMNTGHEGSLTTIHANSPQDALTRLEMMVSLSMANLNLSDKTVRRQIASAIHVIVQIARLPDGTRKVISISETAGIEDENIKTRELLSFKREGVDADGNVLGSVQLPKFVSTHKSKIEAAGFKFPPGMLTARLLVELKTISPDMMKYLGAIIKIRKNILIVGKPGSGVTTFQNALLEYMPEKERIAIIEDNSEPELQLQQPYVHRFFIKTPSPEAKEAKVRDLVVQASEIQPDRIVFGGMRPEHEAEMLKSIAGCQGSIAAITADSPLQAVNRLNENLPDRNDRQKTASSVHAIVHISRLPDGSHKVMSISEVAELEGAGLKIQELYRYQPAGLDRYGISEETFLPTGVKTGFESEIAAAGHSIPSEIRFSFNAGTDKLEASAPSPIPIWAHKAGS
jgi:pilus assembly protein CpaF